MQSELSPTSQPPERFRAAIWTLLLLAPFIAEVVSGSTRLSVLFVFIPEVMVWGGGALLARELVKRWQAGGTSLLLLGLALSVAEELIIQQTSIAPLPFPGANAGYGRAFGMNWVYFLFMLGYESVWVVVVPVQITALFFPRHADKPWLRRRGTIATCCFFVVGSMLAWYGWTQQARVRLGAAPYTPPLGLLLAGCITVCLLVLLAWLLRRTGHSCRSEQGRAWSPWIAGIVTLLLSLVWWKLIAMIFVPDHNPPAAITVAAGAAWALLAFAVVQFLAAPHDWGSMHRWAACFGAVLSCMAAGDLSATGWTRPDLVAKYVFQIAAVAGLLVLAVRIRARPALSAADSI